MAATGAEPESLSDAVTKGRRIKDVHPRRGWSRRGSDVWPSVWPTMRRQSLQRISQAIQGRIETKAIRCSPERLRNRLSVPLYHQSSRSTWVLGVDCAEPGKDDVAGRQSSARSQHIFSPTAAPNQTLPCRGMSTCDCSWRR